MGRRERKKWVHGPGGGLGRGQRQLGIPSPTPGEASVGSPEAASEVLPLPNPRLLPYPHKLGLGKRWGKMPNVKNETPGCDPCNSPSPRHSVGGEVTVNFSLAVSLKAHGDRI